MPEPKHDQLIGPPLPWQKEKAAARLLQQAAQGELGDPRRVKVEFWFDGKGGIFRKVFLNETSGSTRLT